MEGVTFPNSVIDVRFSGGQSYLLRRFPLTVEDFEKQLSQLHYTGAGRSSFKEVENAVLPPFALAFSLLLFETHKIPSENELWEYYNYQFIDDKLKLNRDGIKNRLLRAYPSLIRDFHFYLMCEESGLFEKVYYSFKEDYYDGIDISITSENIKYGISLLVKTKRSLSFKMQKYSRHDYNGKNEIQLTIDLGKEGRKISDFYVYPYEALVSVSEKMIGPSDKSVL